MGHASASHGSGNGGKVVDGAQNGYQLGKLFVGVHICGYGARQHNASRAAYALQKSCCREEGHRAGEAAYH